MRLNFQKYWAMGVAAFVVGAFGPAAVRADVTIKRQPAENRSHDVFVYKFAIPGAFGIPTAARVTNLDSDTLNMLDPPAAVPFGNFLGSSNTVPLIGQQGEQREHVTRSLLHFDVSSLGISASDVISAEIGLFAVKGLPPFADPTATNPIKTELKRVMQSWQETTVTWENQPDASAPITSYMQTGVDQWATFSVTDLVKDWLVDANSNYGVQISQPDIVMAADGSGKPVASLYLSSATADPSQRPYLSIVAVPEPSSIVLGGFASLALIGQFRRRTSNVRG